MIDSAQAALSPDTLRGVDRPIAEARGLPNALFTSEALFAHERDRLFGQTWAVVGAGIDVPKPGDLKPITFMGLPLLVLRDVAGEIRVFHNVCSHRGLELVSKPCSVKRFIQCPYHSWTYDLEGKLRSTPQIGGPDNHDCPGFDRGRHGLKPLRSAVWFDMIFVNLSGDAPAFEDFARPLNERWADYDTSLLRHGGSHSSWSIDLKSNWKFPVENHCDAYHVPWIHPELAAVSRIEDHYEICGEEGFYAGQGSRAFLAGLPEGAPELPRFPGLSNSQQTLAEYISVFPNATVGLHANHVWTVFFDPLAPDRTLERMEIYYLDDRVAEPAYEPVRQELLRLWLNVFQEDQGAVEALQRGRASPAYRGGVFSPARDGAPHHFHRWVARSLDEARA